MVSPEFRPILVFLVAFFAAIFVLPKLAHIADRIGLLDQPNHRKDHSTPKPLVGGIGMMISATFTALLLVPLPGLRGFFGGLATLLLIGFFDDFKEIGHRQKFLAQIFACVLLIYFSKAVLFSFGNLIGLGDIVLPFTWLAWIMTVFCVVGVINAVNLIDGLDGLAGAICFFAFIFFAAHASFAGDTVYLCLNLAFAGAVLGFLRFNYHPASLFMGDAGSLCLGFTLAFMSISMSQGEEAVIRPVTALLILAVPIVDTLTIMTKRILNGNSPFKADRHHLHHIFLRFGLSRRSTVKIIVSISLLFGCISLLGPFYKLPDYLLFSIFIIYFFGYFVASFFIVDSLRYWLRFNRYRTWSGRPFELFRRLIISLNSVRVFRKSAPVETELPLCCGKKQNGQNFDGVVLCISSRGLTADIPEMTQPGKQLDLKISLPAGMNELQGLELSGEHIWYCKLESRHLHGIKFVLDTDKQSAYLEKVVTQLRDR